MTQDQIYQNIAQRTGGDIYIGVVGPVRSGKSSFIKRFAELMLLPRIKKRSTARPRQGRTAPIRRRADDHDNRTKVYPGKSGQH